MLILVMAANTGFADFPRLASFQAGDSFLPRQLTKRGHRLVYSNGVIALAAAAGVLVVVTGAEVTRLIPLYAIGVFTGFTLSQAGMTKHHLRKREPGWRKGVVINGFGALLSAIVAIIIAVTKFADGAWAILIVLPLLVVVFLRLNRQYVREAAHLEADVPAAATAPILRRHVVLVFVDRLDLAAARAIQYARTLTPDELRAVHFVVDDEAAQHLAEEWGRLGLQRVPLELVECPDRRLTRTAVETVARELADGGTEVSVLLPDRKFRGLWHRILHDRTAEAIQEEVSRLPHANVTGGAVPVRHDRRRHGCRCRPSWRPARRSTHRPSGRRRGRGDVSDATPADRTDGQRRGGPVAGCDAHRRRPLPRPGAGSAAGSGRCGWRPCTTPRAGARCSTTAPRPSRSCSSGAASWPGSASGSKMVRGGHGRPAPQPARHAQPGLRAAHRPERAHVVGARRRTPARRQPSRAARTVSDGRPGAGDGGTVRPRVRLRPRRPEPGGRHARAAGGGGLLRAGRHRSDPVGRVRPRRTGWPSAPHSLARRCRSGPPRARCLRGRGGAEAVADVDRLAADPGRAGLAVVGVGRGSSCAGPRSAPRTRRPWGVRSSGVRSRRSRSEGPRCPAHVRGHGSSSTWWS